MLLCQVGAGQALGKNWQPAEKHPRSLSLMGREIPVCAAGSMQTLQMIPEKGLEHT